MPQLKKRILIEKCLLSKENVARYIATRLGGAVQRQHSSSGGKSYQESIETACLVLDDQLRHERSMMDVNGKVFGGTTCCVVWVNENENEMYSCNVGDSRFIMSYKGSAYAITHDHKPYNHSEKDRIFNAGGHVSNDLRVNGILAVSRTFGDFIFKNNPTLEAHEQLVTALPDIRTVDIDDNIDFMVVASDGLWDMMTNDETVHFIVNRMKNDTPLPRICEELIANCEIPIDPDTGMGMDNITIIIALFRDNDDD